ncbi:MAG: dihydroorotase [Paludibacteraceae bacterium]|jgi:dihydroorotase|nr:dihydroorotase [Paludibacteraceae bacterium]
MGKLQLIKNAEIVNEGTIFTGSVVINGEFIEAVYKGKDNFPAISFDEIIDGENFLLLPGVIDDQVHFREPGLTHKADLYTESKAAVAGGVTSFMDMPNTRPPAVTTQLLEEKYRLAEEKSFANYSFYMGATNDNLDELLKIDPHKVCGVKVFMGASTGNMLVDDETTLQEIFKNVPYLIAVHCEDEFTIRKNREYYQSVYGENLSVQFHPLIRNAEACYVSSSKAVALAKKFNSRLHVLHLSTEKEMQLFDNSIPLKNKRITAEVCIHHLWFSDKDYERFGNKIKWNPAIKSESDRQALIRAVNDNIIDIIATDHAPHLLAEKEGNCLTAASGGPLIQHSLVAMLQLAKRGVFSPEKIVDKMCHAPAELFKIEKRGFIRPGYYADLTLVNPNISWNVSSENILYKCGWSPFEGMRFDTRVEKTWVNGNKVYDQGKFDENVRGKRLLFEV